MYCEMVWKYASILLALDSSDLPKFAVAFAIIILVGWLTLVITMGYQLFRRTSSCCDFSSNDTIKGMSASERDRPDEAEKMRADLMALPHVSHTIEKDGIKLAALYFPQLMHSDHEETVDKIENERVHKIADSDLHAAVVDKNESEHFFCSAYSQSEYMDESAEHGSDNPFKGVCAVVVHGWQGHVLSRAKEALQYLNAGFSVLMPALRGHEPTGGDYSDLFLKHYDDLGTWMDHVTKMYGEDGSEKVHAFVLDGVSMGASNVLKMAGDPNLSDSVVAVIADCGYTSLREEGKWMLHKLPAFLRFPVLIATQVFYGVIAGVWNDKPTPLDCVRHARVPVFIIHGERDFLVPLRMGEQLYEACSSEKKELWIVPNATHATSNDFAGADYRRKRHQFIEESLHLFYKNNVT